MPVRLLNNITAANVSLPITSHAELIYPQIDTTSPEYHGQALDSVIVASASGPSDSLTRRSFLRAFGIGVPAVAGTSLLGQSGSVHAATTEGLQSVSHRPQIFTRFPADQLWTSFGAFSRYPLWPFAGDLKSFAPTEPEWTAYLRVERFNKKFDSVHPGQNGFYQVFVCRGEVTLKPQFTGTTTKKYSAGDFFSQWFTENEMARLEASHDAILLVKYQDAPVQPDYLPTEKHSTDYAPFTLPFLVPHRDASGLPFNVRSDFLLGNSLRFIDRDMTAVTMLESFKDNTVAPSHCHPDPVWHEFVYIQGGHITPDGYFGPGGHLVSLPECKEGPYLSTFDPHRAYPPEWPIYASAAEFAADPIPPWPKVFTGKRNDIYGVLFVHYGPFAHITPTRLANWTILKPHQLGPRG